MKRTFFARQPIMNADRRAVGYELLFRNGSQNVFPDIDADYATKLLLSSCFMGEEGNFLGNKIGAVNFAYKSLVNRIPILFPKQSLMVEIQESCPPTPALLKAVKELSEKGYKIALDNFVPKAEWKSFLPYINIIRFDIQATPVCKVKPFMQRLSKTKIRFLAEKIETYEEFEQAKHAGFHFFQGYFFRKPEMMEHKLIQPSFLTMVDLCKVIAKKDIDYEEIEKIITTDVTLSYKLLKYVNSSYLISSEIKSFHQAVAYLGEENLRRFISLIAISTIKENKPDSLYSLSLQRAKFCELLSSYLNRNVQSEQFFLTGLFSLLDALLDQPLEDIIEPLPLNNKTKNALLHGEGLQGKVLKLVINYEQTDWNKVDALADKLGILPTVITDCYEDAIIWTEGQIRQSKPSTK